MTRRWPLLLPASFLLGITGCVNLRQDAVPRTPPAPEVKRDPGVTAATYQAMEERLLPGKPRSRPRARPSW